MKTSTFLILGLWIGSSGTSWGQINSVLNPDPAVRTEKKVSGEDISPVESPKKSNVVVRYLQKKHDRMKVAETTHFRILEIPDRPLGPAQPVATPFLIGQILGAQSLAAADGLLGALAQGLGSLGAMEFEVFILDRPVVEKVGQIAELTRTSLQRKWFGDEGTDWDGQCAIYLHGNRENYAARTKMDKTLGHMHTLSLDGVFLRSIHLPLQDASQVIDVLPHEVSHSVMAVRFQGRTPRWADEGMAMLAETPASLKDCLDRLPRYRRTDALFSLEVLTQTEEADQMNTMEYYAQSTSLVQFLTSLKGPRAFTDFLRTYIMKGAEPALMQHYAIRGYSDLEKRWQAFAFAKKARRATD